MSTTKTSTIRVGIFADTARAGAAIENLVSAGFSREAVSVICSDERKAERLEKNTGEDVDSLTHDDPTLKAGIAGGVIGGLVALAGVALTGGIGIMAVGPLVAGGVTGTLLGALIGEGVEDDLARFYEQAVTEGNVLVAVHLEDESHTQAIRADAILRESGAAPVTLESTD